MKKPQYDKNNSYDNNDRNASLKLIDWFDIRTVRKASILVVGAGAIGNEVLKNLALLGIGNIFIFDRDTIEKSNLSRSVLFREHDDGKHKAEIAARSVKEINPTVNARWKNGDIRFDMGLGFINRMDVVIAGFDNIEARRKINELCWLADRPWIEAGIEVFDGHVSVFYPNKGACFECYSNRLAKINGSFRLGSIKTGIGAKKNVDANSCQVIASKYAEEGKVATTPTIASIVGGIQAQEALKLLSLKKWRNFSLISKRIRFLGSIADVSVSDLEAFEECDKHETINKKAVVRIPGVDTNTRIGDLVKAVKKDLGRHAVIELWNELIVEYECRKCRTVNPVLKFRASLFKEDLACSVCHTPPKYYENLKKMTHLSDFKEFAIEKKLLNSTLAELGVPPLEWLTVNGSRIEFDGECYLEIGEIDKFHGFNDMSFTDI